MGQEKKDAPLSLASSWAWKKRRRAPRRRIPKAVLRLRGGSGPVRCLGLEPALGLLSLLGLLLEFALYVLNKPKKDTTASPSLCLSKKKTHLFLEVLLLVGSPILCLVPPEFTKKKNAPRPQAPAFPALGSIRALDPPELPPERKLGPAPP